MDVDVDVVTAEDGHGFNSSTSSTSSVCAQGYQEVMCSSCAPDFFSSGESCVKCPKASDLSATPTFIALVLALVLALGAVVWLWVRRPAQTQQPPRALSALIEQVKAQVPLLLQLCDSAMTSIFREAEGSSLVCFFRPVFFPSQNLLLSSPSQLVKVSSGRFWLCWRAKPMGRALKDRHFGSFPMSRPSNFQSQAWRVPSICSVALKLCPTFSNKEGIPETTSRLMGHSACLLCSRCWCWNPLF